MPLLLSSPLLLPPVFANVRWRRRRRKKQEKIPFLRLPPREDRGGDKPQFKAKKGGKCSKNKYCTGRRCPCHAHEELSICPCKMTFANRSRGGRTVPATWVSVSVRSRRKKSKISLSSFPPFFTRCPRWEERRKTVKFPSLPLCTGAQPHFSRKKKKERNRRWHPPPAGP